MQIRDKNLNLTGSYTFLKTSHTYNTIFVSGSYFSGSTALFCVLENNRLHVANVGDSRAVAVKKSDGKVVQITTDHKPINVTIIQCQTWSDYCIYFRIVKLLW